jgi:hypothetical protein
MTSITETPVKLDIEAVCLAILSAAGEKIEPPAKSALSAVVNWIANEIDDWEEIEEIAEDEGVTAWEYIRDHVLAYLESDEYRAETLRLYRSIRVTCPPDEVVTAGTAGDIGTSWSLNDEIDDPTFLSQYGRDGGRDVAFVAKVRHDDVNWLVTLWKQVDPRVADYNEVVLLSEAVPTILSVTDPGIGAAPAP